MEQEKANNAVWSVGAIVVLAAALALGIGVKKLRQWRAESGTSGQAVPKTVRVEKAPASSGPTAFKAGGEQFSAEVEVNETADNEANQADETAVVDAGETAEREQPERNGPAGGGGQMDWRRMWEDLNLTPEETARLRDGMRLAMEKWQNMSEDERQAEIGRLQGLRMQWENMSDEERQAAMERGRERFEQWRASGDVELPPITLD